MYSGLKIMGLHSVSKSDREELNIPDNIFVSGYMTNYGDLYSYTDAIVQPLLMCLCGKYYTKKELSEHFKNYHRREKLKKIKLITDV